MLSLSSFAVPTAQAAGESITGINQKFVIEFRLSSLASIRVGLGRWSRGAESAGRHDRLGPPRVYHPSNLSSEIQSSSNFFCISSIEIQLSSSSRLSPQRQQGSGRRAAAQPESIIEIQSGVIEFRLSIICQLSSSPRPARGPLPQGAGPRTEQGSSSCLLDSAAAGKDSDRPGLLNTFALSAYISFSNTQHRDEHDKMFRLGKLNSLETGGHHSFLFAQARAGCRRPGPLAGRVYQESRESRTSPANPFIEIQSRGFQFPSSLSNANFLIARLGPWVGGPGQV